MKLIQYSLLIYFLSGCFSVAAQVQPYVPGQILLSLPAGHGPERLLQTATSDFSGQAFQIRHQVSDLLNTWLLQTDGDPDTDRLVLAWLRRQPEVQSAQFNHRLELRADPPDLLPNDPLFAQQWQHQNSGANGGVFNADMDSDQAWNIAVGGVSPLGDTIVVAVIDGGIEHNHEDLAPNMWRNYADVPGDHIDNDLNGYVDDHLGWNVFSGTDNIAGLSTGHGTPVSAILGAKGDNNKGVAGVNWAVKIMFVAGNDDEATILSAYDYVLKARKRYNASKGQQGAFVVAVNCSWGITMGQPEDSPLWCAAFDSLGKAGILGVAATDNNPNDVDVVGDMPTGCPSDYLSAVTSLTRSDTKASNAAWGPVSVDLGAYGKDVFTATISNTYGTVSGTSFAAPQVSGAVGLLYSAPCSNLAAMARANPAAAAQLAKSLILNTATPNANLEALTVTGGRLNLHTLLRDYQDNCVSCLPPFAPEISAVSTSQAMLAWSKVADVQSVTLRWRKLGDLSWTQVGSVQGSYLLSGLQPCTDYEFALRSTCTGSASAWSASVSFRTDGCCEPPASIGAISIGSATASVTWTSLTAAQGFRVRIKPKANTTWQVYQVVQNNIQFQDLSPCTEYEMEVQTLCGNDSASFSNPYFFITAGCGACTDLDYCQASAGSANDEWISGVEIGDWGYYSSSGSGYVNQTGGLDNLLNLLPNQPLPLTLTPGFSGWPYNEYFRIYIDYSGDGDFDDPFELAFDPGFASGTQIIDTLEVPDFSYNGLTRMRVLMKFKSTQAAPPSACEQFEFGQVIDLCIRLGPVLSAFNPEKNQAAFQIYPQPAQDQVILQFPDQLERPCQLLILDAGGRTLWGQTLQPGQKEIPVDIRYWPSGLYTVGLKCQAGMYWKKMIKAGR
ncbi:MAG: S8 family serine peptidase [Saprospiraceae bacterium]|nr:S8 family serine peptidase [Saprospiraceae bacterium]